MIYTSKNQHSPEYWNTFSIPQQRYIIDPITMNLFQLIVKIAICCICNVMTMILFYSVKEAIGTCIILEHQLHLSFQRPVSEIPLIFLRVFYMFWGLTGTLDVWITLITCSKIKRASSTKIMAIKSLVVKLFVEKVFRLRYNIRRVQVHDSEEIIVASSVSWCFNMNDMNNNNDWLLVRLAPSYMGLLNPIKFVKISSLLSSLPLWRNVLSLLSLLISLLLRQSVWEAASEFV